MKAKIKSEIKFNEKGTFESFYAACHWLKNAGYSYGSMCRDEPIGIMKGDFMIAKWKNIMFKEKKQLHGVMISNDFREGEVIIQLFK